jgi:hypothetical protein
MDSTMVEKVETRNEIDPEQAAEAEMARRRRGGHWLMAAAWVLSSGLALGAEAPAPGQTLAEWQNAVTAELEARGRKMGFALEPCALKPPFAGAPQTYLSRAFSQDDKMVLALVAVRDGKVTDWKEFELPGLEGWFTRALHACNGKFLEIRFDGRLSQRFRWSGQSFTLAPRGTTRRDYPR